MSFSSPCKKITWTPLLLLVSIAIFLMFSWLQPDMRHAWDRLDHDLFRWLNNSLSSQGIWTDYWAIMNVRLMDLLALFIMLSLLITPNIIFKAGSLRIGLLGFVILLFFMLFIREALDSLVDYFTWNRPSPTLVLSDTIRLSALYPQLNPKDSSATSFPGDHAGVLMLWAFYCWSFARNKWSWFVLLVTLAFTLPRLVGGGHWLSDDLVGGGVIAILTLALVRYTPIFLKTSNILVRWFSPFLNYLAKFMPILNRLSFFSKG